MLDPDRTVLDARHRRRAVRPRAAGAPLLGAFLFSGDSVDKKVRVLSGGERNRLALALLLLHPPNCLLLDEPTNHLDMTAKQVLLEALQRYTGTLVLVAHDRYILDQLPEEIIEVGAGHATRYLGNYEDYVARKAAEANGSLPPPVAVHDDAVAAGDEAPAPAPTAAERRAAAKTRGARRGASRERDQARLEQEIADKEDALAAVSRGDQHARFLPDARQPAAAVQPVRRSSSATSTRSTRKLERLEQAR